jgi:tetratricopeptide (TPR) repeat protein
MADKKLNLENFVKLNRLLQEARSYFAEIFKENYKQKFKSEWKDNKQSANEFRKSAEKLRSDLKKSELVNFDNGNTSDWDLTLLGKVLTSNVFKDSNTKWINDIIEIRNKTAHSSDITISDKKYEELYAKYSKAMISLGYSAEKLNKFKIDISKKDKYNNTNFSDIEQAKKMANEEINNKNYSKAIEIYSNMLKSFDDLSSEQKADLFYERSRVNLLYYGNINSDDEKYLHRSLLDAKQSNMLEPRWSKTYSLIAEIYHKLNELEESENYFEMALALDVSNEEIKNSLALVKSKNNQQNRNELMNPNFFPGTTEERNKNLFNKMTQKMGLSSKISESPGYEKSRDLVKDLIGKHDPSFFDVIIGETFEFY